MNLGKFANPFIFVGPTFALSKRQRWSANKVLNKFANKETKHV